MDTLENAQRRAEYWKAEHLAANAEIERLRRALIDCDHQTDSMRVWGGMEWKYHPPQAGRIHKIARAALDTVPNA